MRPYGLCMLGPFCDLNPANVLAQEGMCMLQLLKRMAGIIAVTSVPEVGACGKCRRRICSR